MVSVRLIEQLALGDVACDRDQLAALHVRPGRPFQPPVGAVLVPVAVFEAEDLFAGLRLPGCFGNGWLAIVGVDEVEERSRQQLVLAVAERARPRRVHAGEVPVEARGHEQVERQLLMRRRLGEPLPL